MNQATTEFEAPVDTYNVEQGERILREAAKAYYNGEPTMSDGAYDTLWRRHLEARRVRPGDPFWETSILNEVGAAPQEDSGFTKVDHLVPMQSLDNLFVKSEADIGEVFQWLKKLTGGEALTGLPIMARIIAEPKIDGLSLSVVYENGVLQRAVTRGDGFTGEDVTANVRAAELVPEVLEPQAGILEVRGEVFMPFAAFERLTEQHAREGKKAPANPRNAAAGIMRRQDPKQIPSDCLEFIAYGTAAGETEEGYDFECNRLTAMGFKVPYQKAMLANGTVGDAVPVTHAWLQEVIEDCYYPTDGVVLKVTGYNFREQLGSTSRAPRWATAIKFDQEKAKTRLQGITVQVGRTGVLTPVAELEPVLVDGSMVSRASLHNQDQVNRLGLQVGDVVVIQKAGAIIPEVVGIHALSSVATIDELREETVRATRDDNGHGHMSLDEFRTFWKNQIIETNRMTFRPEWSLLEHIRYKCPSCGGGDLVLRKPRATGKSAGINPQIFACASPTCKAQMGGRVEHMAGRDRLDLDQLGTEACDEIGFRAGLDGIEHQFDVLNQPIGWFANLSWTTESGGTMTFGESRARKVVAAIEKAKKLPLRRWIAALGIHSIGDNTSKEITRLCRTSEALIMASISPDGIFRRLVEFNALGNAGKKEYEAIKEKYGVSSHLGPVSLMELVNFVTNNREIIERIPETAVSDNYAPELPKEATGSLAGKTFVITGTLSLPRTHFEELIAHKGGKVSGSISKSTDFLLAGEKAGSKLAKAEKLGVKVLNEDEFSDMILEWTRYQKIAAAAVAAYLREKDGKPVILFDVSCHADQAAYDAGRKTELYPSLYDYADLLPDDWKTSWLSASDSPTADSMLYAIPRDWKSGDSDSEQLLLGGGILRHARS